MMWLYPIRVSVISHCQVRRFDQQSYMAAGELLAVLGGDLPSLVGRRSAGGNEMLELCWEAMTYWRPARCLAGEVSRTVLQGVGSPATVQGVGSPARSSCRTWDLRRGAHAVRGVSGEIA
jgi:hypothetical protein